MENLPRQESNVEKPRVRINSWAASREEKWRHVPKKLTSYLLLHLLSSVYVDPFLLSSDFLVFSLLIFLAHAAIFLHDLPPTSLFRPAFFHINSLAE